MVWMVVIAAVAVGGKVSSGCSLFSVAGVVFAIVAAYLLLDRLAAILDLRSGSTLSHQRSCLLVRSPPPIPALRQGYSSQLPFPIECLSPLYTRNA